MTTTAMSLQEVQDALIAKGALSVGITFNEDAKDFPREEVEASVAHVLQAYLEGKAYPMPPIRDKHLAFPHLFHPNALFSMKELFDAGRALQVNPHSPTPEMVLVDQKGMIKVVEEQNDKLFALAKALGYPTWGGDDWPGNATINALQFFKPVILRDHMGLTYIEHLGNSKPWEPHLNPEQGYPLVERFFTEVRADKNEPWVFVGDHVFAGPTLYRAAINALIWVMENPDKASLPEFQSIQPYDLSQDKSLL